jgi:hypothetical protein
MAVAVIARRSCTFLGPAATEATLDFDPTISTGVHSATTWSLLERGLAALDGLEPALDAVSQAPPGSLRDALAGLDATFSELTGRDPVRNPGRAYGARTLVYIDFMRDLDVTLGGTLVTEIAPALQVLKTLLMQCPPEIKAELAEMHRRLATLLADPSPETVGARAAAVFADHRPAWPTSVFQSVDVQLAARDQQAVADGDWLAVIGDMHPGANPLTQGLFAHRHPTRRRCSS